MSEERLRKIALSVRNWGRWGPDDEIGTLDYITPEAIAAYAADAAGGKAWNASCEVRVWNERRFR
jgi:hypothetical protein